VRSELSAVDRFLLLAKQNDGVVNWRFSLPNGV